ncbi:MAG: hypothetical protein QMD08_00035 [Actinomycetota bacterium]|nr:hypothetical protein [Actinomycetota bacterium]
MKRANSDVIWVVVKVESGIPVSVEVFGNPTAARHREKQLRAEMNPDNDEVGIFTSQVPDRT